MASDKVTITFDSFEDFKRFLLDPPSVRLEQIALGGSTHYSEPKKESAPLQRVTPQEHVFLTLRRWVSEKGKAMPVKKLAAQACRAMGMRATERSIASVLWHVHQLTAKKQIHRVTRGYYTVGPAASAKKAKRG